MTGSASRRATIKDVAKEAQVSVTTVSNVLNGRTGAMSPQTLSRVQSVIANLAYRPSSLARSLVSGHGGSLAFGVGAGCATLIPDALLMLASLARESGYDLAFAGSGGSSGGDSVPAGAVGLIYLCDYGRADAATIRAAVDSGIPVVAINPRVDDPARDRIGWDETGGASLAVDHLASLGHQRIAHFRGSSSCGGVARYQGYVSALHKNGLALRPEWVFSLDEDAPVETWRQAARKLLTNRPRPTALFAAEDSFAAVAIAEFARAGVRVPADVAVVGMGDHSYCNWLNPTVTSVSLPVADAIAGAFSMMMERLSAPDSRPEARTLPCKLVIRESCGATRATTRAATADRPAQGSLW